MTADRHAGLSTLFRCRRCLYPNTKPDLWFDERGICSACIAFEKRELIDWDAKREEFLSLVRSHPGSTHDVIVACSGGKDSTAQIVKCLELGLRPLAVTATTDHLSDIGRKNLDNISNLCDHVEVTPHKPTRRKISKFALCEVGDISWCEHHLIWSVPAREAVARNIPIVLYGECPQNEYGAGPAGSENQTQLTHDWVHEFGGLLGLRLSDVADILGIEPKHLEIYRYPQGHVKAVFMGAYFPWDGWENFLTAEANGFLDYEPAVEGSGVTYENLDNYQTGIHDYLRFCKFGYGRACDIASNQIRRGRLTRAAALMHLSEWEGAYPTTYLGKPVSEILDNIGMNCFEFEEVCERFRNWPVLEWALSLESFQCFSGTSTDASKGEVSILDAG
jgi:N-acetyl sugar amidotransferase